MRFSLERVGILPRLWMIAAAFLIPVAVLFQLWLAELDQAIDFAKKEIHGTHFQRPLEELLHLVQEHELTRLKLSEGDQAMQRSLMALNEQIEQVFAQLEQLVADYGQELQFTEAGLTQKNHKQLILPQWKERWEILKQASSKLKTVETEARLYETFIADIRLAITHIGDTSNLILDPDLDSFYLMSVTLVEMPELQSLLGNVLLDGNQYLKDQNLSSPERLQLGIVAAQMQAEASRIDHDLATALTEDANFHGVSSTLEASISDGKKELMALLRQLQTTLSKLSLEEKPSTSQVEFVKMVNTTRQTAFSYWHQCAAQLDELLRLRIRDFRSERRVGIMALAVAILLACGLVWLIAQGLIRPIRNVVVFAAKISKGDLSTRVFMGRPVECSSVKGCNQPSCRSYGKEVHCWVTSGSFSLFPDCPAVVKKGMDCRDCIVYKQNAGTEMAEIGSALNALAMELQIRAENAEAIAGGDLTMETHIASASDTLGQAIAKMTDSLELIIRRVVQTTQRVNAEATQVASSSEALSQGAAEQAAALEEISSSMHQIGMQTRTNAEVATQANLLTNEARNCADLGNTQMKAMMNAMVEINTASREIAKIIKIIDDIAFQTNLLALNAAVEAARAGRFGKGFAVVAEEVRNLASRSAKAAQETAELIESSVKKVENGNEIAEQTAQALLGIAAKITKVTDLMGEIAAASQGQAHIAGQVSDAINQIEGVTHQNTATAEQNAAAAEELSTQVTQLQTLLAKFKLKAQNEAQASRPAVQGQGQRSTQLALINSGQSDEL